MTLDAGLTKIATLEAEYLAQTGRLGHFTYNGAGPGARAQATGINVITVPVGENAGVDPADTLAAGFKLVTDQMWAEPPNPVDAPR